MKLRSLQLHGFKSFADRTTLEFRDGVTAVVGSNGSGKSNVADAIRWVLGEQRASAVRGAKMDEVIFAGSVRRRPLAFAEVLLRFDNTDGAVPVPQTELEIARKTFREGGSEYALNRVGCRLRDVQDLLRDTGLGGSAPFVIESGMIDAILSDRAEERRALFEEAAGIGSYKDRRRAAGRRLESAEGDLARLGDLIAEVDAKVRSLGRQRRRAERYEQIQARRLALEIALSLGETERWAAELATASKRIAHLELEASAAAAERAAAEADAEARERESAQLRDRRGTAYARSEEVRSRLGAREREVLVVEERRSHAEMRLGQLSRERTELTDRLERLERDARLGEAEVSRARAALREVQERLGAETSGNATLREAVAERRQASAAASARELTAARDAAAAEAELTATARRADDIHRRAERLRSEHLALHTDGEALGAEAARTAAALETARGQLEARTAAASASAAFMKELRAREQEASIALRAAEDAAGKLEARVGAQEATERNLEGYAPAVAAILRRRSEFAGVVGLVADLLPSSAGEASLIDAYLGPLLQALVVRDLDAARALRQWFRDKWTGGGSLLIIVADPNTAEWNVGAWSAALLDGVRRVDSDSLLTEWETGPRVDDQGDIVDARGVIRLGEAGAGEGILARREALQRLRAERDGAIARREQRRAERDAAVAQRESAEMEMRRFDEERRAIEADLRRHQADLAEHSARAARLEREREARERDAGAAAEEAASLSSRVSDLNERVKVLRTAAAAAVGESTRARTELHAGETAWEAARDREAELRVAAARAEGDLRDAERRQSSAENSAAGARRRLGTLDAEGAELRASLSTLTGVRTRAAEELEQLFAARDSAAVVLAELDQGLEESARQIRSLEESARGARRKEAEAAELRHRLELDRADIGARIARSRERLEAEWGRPWDVLVDGADLTAGGPDEWAAELRDLGARLEQLGPVNALAAAEHAEEERRLTFLREQEADLLRARGDLTTAIREINRTARERFQQTFDEVRTHFGATFQSLFQGGECDVWLADVDDPLESPIEVFASPRGKRTQRIGLLSGGERTLAALALLFAIYLVKPSPFCLFDEVDAPLDEANVLRFVDLLNDFKDRTQFIVITHNPRTMEAADWIYGVTMEEPGVSGIVGVTLEGVWSSGERVA